MDGDSGKGSAGELVLPKEGEGAAVKDAASQDNLNGECLIRKRCRGRIDLDDLNHVFKSRRGRKITDESSVDANIFTSNSSVSDSASVHGGLAAGEDDSDATSIRAHVSVNVNNNTRLSSMQNVSNDSLSIGFTVGNPEAEMQINFRGSSLSQNISANAVERLHHAQMLHEAFSINYNGSDQYRDMRMNIDNMPYEELLALGDRIGYVSTAVSEETLSKCIKKCIYQMIPSEAKVIGYKEDGDDMKCSICQEEYVPGNEIGKLVECQHCYHASCINQWLQLKNWCPICKMSVAPSQ